MGGAGPVEQEAGAQGRLFGALARGLLALGRRRPLVAVFDDLHWAEAASVEAFLHLALALADSAGRERVPVCLIGLHRPPMPGDAMERALARMRREPVTRQVVLGGLDELALSDLIHEATAATCGASLLETIRDVTQGNPLFILEALDALAREGSIRLEDGQLVSEARAEDLPLPREVTAAIEARVRDLPTELKQLLVHASLLGDDIEIGTLSVVAEKDEDDVLDLLEQARELRLVAESGESFRFAHPVIRNVVEHSVSGPRRARMHARIASQLIELEESDGDRVLRIANHLGVAGSAADGVARGRYASQAGEIAYARSAWGESARHYEVSLGSRDYVECLDDLERARLSAAAADAHERNHDFLRCRERYAEAVETFREQRDFNGWAAALIGWARTYAAHTDPNIDFGKLQEFVDAAGDGYDSARARVLAFWAEVAFAIGSPEATEKAREARELARRAEDWHALIQANISLGGGLLRVLDVPGAVACYEEARDVAEREGDTWHLGWALARLPLALIPLGRIEEAEAAAVRACEESARAHEWSAHSLALALRVCIEVGRGELDEAERIASLAQAAIDRAGYLWSPLFLYPALAYGRALRARQGDALDALDLLDQALGPANGWLLRRLVAPEEDAEAVRNDVAGNPRRVEWWVRGGDAFTLGLLGTRIGLAERLGDAGLAERPLEHVGEAQADGVRCAIAPPYLLPRLEGVGQRLAGDDEAAREAFERALRDGERTGMRLERARAAFAYAELLAESAETHDRTRAAAMLGDAIHAFEEMGLVALLPSARALATRHGFAIPGDGAGDGYPAGLTELEYEVLLELAEGAGAEAIGRRLLLSPVTVERALAMVEAKAGVATAEAAMRFVERSLATGKAAIPTGRVAGFKGMRTLLFTDIVDSTPLIERLGDAAYVELLATHDRVVKSAISSAGGTAVKHTGDGYFAWFREPRAAIRCAFEIQRRMPVRLESAPDVGMNVRAGIHLGDAIETRNDLFGLAVTLAARVCGRARTGEVLVSEPVRAAAPDAARFRRRGRFALKGVSDRIALYEAMPTRV
jgi:class 3 adenylate cyclase/tetratricopeptide (TPR) repeat protein